MEKDSRVHHSNYDDNLPRPREEWIKFGPEYLKSIDTRPPQFIVHLQRTEDDEYKALVDLTAFSVTLDYGKRGYAVIAIKQLDESKT